MNDYYNWGSPTVSGGNVYMGIASNCDSPLVPGGLKEYNQSTGALEATHYSLPAGAAGGSIWSSPGVAADGSIVVTTGNSKGTTDLPGSNSITRLDPTTLGAEDTWQVPPAQQVHDSDFGGSPTMFTAALNGASTPMVGACNKNGTYYAFRQSALSDGPVWTYQMGDPSRLTPAQASATQRPSGTVRSSSRRNQDQQRSRPGIGTIPRPSHRNPAVADGSARREEIGSPSEDGAGVVAASVFSSTTGKFGVYLLDASTGTILSSIQTKAPVFSQPVFAQRYLFVAGATGFGLAACH